jgi:Holliday junction resolvase
MSASSRRKGADAERELAELLREHGLAAQRNPVQALFGGADVLGVRLAGRELHLEAKRCERLDLPRWLRQVRADCPVGTVPVIAFRRSHEPWQVVLPLEDLLALVHAGRFECAA